MAVDEVTRAVIEAMSAFFPKGAGGWDAAEVRRTLAEAPPLETEPRPVGQVVDRLAGNVPVRVYSPPEGAQGGAGDGGGRPVVVYFHGGGFTICSLDTHDAVCRDICAGAEAVVVSVDYRLAPEHPYPAAVEDACAATRWAHEHAAELGGDPGRLVVAGDSAGGNLATVVCLKARDERAGPPISLQVLIYPVTDADQDTPSYRENGTGYFLTAAHMRWFWDCYQPDPARRAEPYSSPVHADLSGLPPALVLTAEHDPLRDEGEAYARLLGFAGVPAHGVRYDGMFHGFYGFYGMGAVLPAAKEASELVNSVIRTGDVRAGAS
ncbi:alpha/beta hydrolase [Nonomuraea sp. NN258]|uniref:alpha/beta hydrolase n=1 Tax=Nonomuraea antri TaxID=2730852 RepID=UPI0015688491|nr:alpha/beta hydrolase [Nonomuraea antri]NRQ34352.1 alpha/beta hydrolase [Nonomuraea antri]